MPSDMPTATTAADDLEADALMRLIIERYHADHLRDLAEAVAMANAVEAAHEGDAECPRGLSRLLVSIKSHLEVHQRMEERVLFPLLLRWQAEASRLPLGAVRHDHDDLQGRLQDLVRMTDSFTAPGAACATWRALYRLMSRFHDELREHIRLETQVLFPRFVAQLAPAQRSIR